MNSTYTITPKTVLEGSYGGFYLKDQKNPKIEAIYNILLRNPKYHLTETLRPLIEV